MATFILADASQNVACDAVVDRFDAGAAAGYIDIYDGTMPADPDTGPTTQNKLVTFTMPDPAFGSAGAVTVGKATISSTATGTAALTGTPTWGIAYDSDDSIIGIGDAGNDGDEVFVLNAAKILSGSAVTLTMSLTMPRGNE